MQPVSQSVSHPVKFSDRMADTHCITGDKGWAGSPGVLDGPHGWPRVARTQSNPGPFVWRGGEREGWVARFEAWEEKEDPPKLSERCVSGWLDGWSI